MSIACLPRRNSQLVRQPRRHNNCDRAPVAAARLILAKHLLYPIQPILCRECRLLSTKQDLHSCEECREFSFRHVQLIFETKNGNRYALVHNASSRLQGILRDQSSKDRGQAHCDRAESTQLLDQAQGERANPFGGDLYWVPVSYTLMHHARKGPFTIH
jgi:hypothetical protein